MDAVLAVITALEKAIITKDALEVSSSFFKINIDLFTFLK